ncbi:MAG: hypothetical protein M3R38_07575 [Actinomycetota bacterium]|nr:hypothetical protein [Actinomycetota bacterium]
MTETVVERLEVEGSAEELFEFWSKEEVFCEFVRYAQETRRVDLSGSRWLLRGSGKFSEKLEKKFEPEEFRGCLERTAKLYFHAYSDHDRAAGGAAVVDWGAFDLEPLSSGRTLFVLTTHFATAPEGDREGKSRAEGFSDLVLTLLSRPRRGAGAGPKGPEGAPPERTERAAVDPLLALLREWESDEPGYDEETLPSLKEALDRDRPSYRKLFGRG